MWVAGGGAETGRLALEENLGVCFTHDGEGGGSNDAAEDGQQPEGPAPAFVGCDEASNDRAENLDMDGLLLDVRG